MATLTRQHSFHSILEALYRRLFEIYTTVCSDSHLIYSISLIESMCFKSQHILWKPSGFTSQRQAVISQEAMHNKSVWLEWAQISALFPHGFCTMLNLKCDRENKEKSADKLSAHDILNLPVISKSLLIILWISRNVFTCTLLGFQWSMSENGRLYLLVPGYIKENCRYIFQPDLYPSHL